MATIYVGNDNVLKVTALADDAGTYINTATVTATLEDESGAEVSGETWPITLSYVSASDGNYQGVLKDTLSLSTVKEYTAKITADDGANKKGYWEFPLRSAARTS